MAPSLIEKVNTLINASLHGIVDRALEQNSVAVMDEYIRQAEKNLEALEDSAATVGGTVKTLKRKYEEISAQAEKLDRDIDTLLTRGQADLAAKMQAKLNTQQQLAQSYYEQWQSQESEYKKMLDAKLKLESKLNTARQEREHLAELMKLAEAKAQTTKTIKSLSDIQGIGDQDISRVADAIRERLDREDAKLELSSQRLAEQVEDTLENSVVDSQLEERKKRLGLSS